MSTMKPFLPKIGVYDIHKLRNAMCPATQRKKKKEAKNKKEKLLLCSSCRRHRKRKRRRRRKSKRNAQMIIVKTLKGFLQNPIRFPPKPFTLSPQTLKGYSILEKNKQGRISSPALFVFGVSRRGPRGSSRR